MGNRRSRKNEEGKGIERRGDNSKGKEIAEKRKVGEN